jgi:hypothetical protein
VRGPPASNFQCEREAADDEEFMQACYRYRNYHGLFVGADTDMGSVQGDIGADIRRSSLIDES